MIKNKYLKDLQESFKKIRVADYETQALGKKEKIYTQRPENNFTALLKRHFENLIDLPENIEPYKGLVCHMDIFKGRKGKPIRPDLVLHAGQNNQDNQLIFVEVKLRYYRDSGLSDDLLKLKRAISTEYNFKYGVMVVVNESMERTKSIILDFIDKELNATILRKLYLFHAVKNSDNSTATYTIKNFLRIKNDG